MVPVMKEGGPFFTSNAAPAALFAGLAKPPETDFRGTSRRALGTDILHAARALAITVGGLWYKHLYPALL